MLILPAARLHSRPACLFMRAAYLSTRRVQRAVVQQGSHNEVAGLGRGRGGRAATRPPPAPQGQQGLQAALGV